MFTFILFPLSYYLYNILSFQCHLHCAFLSDAYICHWMAARLMLLLFNAVNMSYISWYQLSDFMSFTDNVCIVIFSFLPLYLKLKPTSVNVMEWVLRILKNIFLGPIHYTHIIAAYWYTVSHITPFILNKCVIE